MYAGLRARNRRWFGFGLLYVLPVTALSASTLLPPGDHAVDSPLVGLWFLCWIVALIHVFSIRGDYLLRVGAPTSFSATPWILPGFVLMGGPGLLYAGIRAKAATWAIFRLLYTLPLVALAIPSSIGRSTDEPLYQWIVGGWLVSSAAALMHGLVVRSEYGIRRRNPRRG